mmetsp:Transcript_32869/g.45647  ORF Transcript_32869/g.45647 Transcript_32869/m.45647 type:complete len:109 (+) Transcript_32869:190-516(+)
MSKDNILFKETLNEARQNATDIVSEAKFGLVGFLGNDLNPPVSESTFLLIALVLLTVGLWVMAYFFVYEVTTTKFSRSILKELSIALVSSLFMGYGSLFLLLSSGVSV